MPSRLRAPHRRARHGDPTPIPEHLHTVTPRLVVSDGAAAIDFYMRAFGATQIGEPFLDPGGRVIHGEVEDR